MQRPVWCRRYAAPILVLLLTVLAPLSVATREANGDAPLRPLVVLADPNDTYHALAREIAGREGAPLATNPDEALALRPDLLIWVVSPSKLSDRVLVQYGMAVARAGAMPALGFISGSSLDRARALYQRSLTMTAPLVAMARGSWGGHTEVIRYDRRGPPSEEPLTLASFRRALEQVDGLMYRGHGSADYLRFNDSTTFVAGDVPSRVPRLVATYACNTFRIWTGPQSIAMVFVDRGTGAYIGYSYSPLPGFQMTEGFPFRHTWPGFPIGRLVQLQSAASMRGMFAFPAYHLLGNPRISVRGSPPYTVVSDRSDGGERVVTLADRPADIIPVRIDGGAAFETTEVAGRRVWRQDPFYNGRLQVLDVGPDRYLLLQHPGGPVTIRLSMDRPILSTIGGVMLKGLDLCLVVYPGADRVACGAFAVLGIIGVAWGVMRRKVESRAAIAGLGLGGLFAAGHVGYAAFRVSRLDVVSSVDPPLHAWMFAATWALVAWGACRFFVARTRKGCVLGVAVAVLNAATMVFVWLGWPLVFNTIVVGRLGGPLYNSRPGLLTLTGATAMAMLAMVAFASAARIARGGLKPRAGSSSPA